MSSIKDVHCRKATSADVAAMAACQSADPANAANPRMAAYFERQHHPQRALFPRVGYVAVANGEVIGYIAGHLTTRHDCEGEIQYLLSSTGPAAAWSCNCITAVACAFVSETRSPQSLRRDRR